MTTLPPEPSTAPLVGERTVRRIAYLIPTFGIFAGLLAGLLHHWDWAAGIVLGAGLAWLNFRWLKRGIAAFTTAAASHGSRENTRQPVATYLAAAFRYVLIGVSVYVIFKYLQVPLVSIFLGLCAFAAATIAASVWEILQSTK
jgi:hypothetical protein